MLPYIAGEVPDRRSNQLRGKRAVASPVVAMACDATRQIDHPAAAQQWVPGNLWRGGAAGLLSIRKPRIPQQAAPASPQRSAWKSKGWNDFHVVLPSLFRRWTLVMLSRS